jgi:hypothetical protein
MFFNKAALLSAVLVVVGYAAAVPAAASAPNEFGLIITNAVPLPDGATLTVWGEAPGYESTNSTIAKRQCGSNDVTCSGSHVPNTDSCNQLIDSLLSNGGVVLGDSPRSVCLTQNGAQCCTSWSAVVHGLQEFSLASAATKILNNCVGPNRQSGLARNVNLQGVCLTQCLSDRATGCTWKHARDVIT